MARPSTLSRSPVTEALLDVKTSVTGSEELFKEFAAELKSEFPKVKVTQQVTAKMEVRDGKIIPPEGQIGFRGVQLFSADDSQAVQFRLDGFTFNNLNSYLGGDALIGRGLSLWELFAIRFKPTSVSRVALRSINKLSLPLVDGDNFEKFLTAPPGLPEGSPQSVSEFLSRIVAHDLARDCSVVVTQRLTTEPTGPDVIIDIDAFRIGELQVQTEVLRPIFENLRALKNEVFFSLLTDETVRIYL